MLCKVVYVLSLAAGWMPSYGIPMCVCVYIYGRVKVCMHKMRQVGKHAYVYMTIMCRQHDHKSMFKKKTLQSCGRTTRAECYGFFYQ